MIRLPIPCDSCLFQSILDVSILKMERVCKYLAREIRKGKVGMIFWKVELLKKRWIFPFVVALFMKRLIYTWTCRIRSLSIKQIEFRLTLFLQYSNFSSNVNFINIWQKKKKKMGPYETLREKKEERYFAILFRV